MSTVRVHDTPLGFAGRGARSHVGPDAATAVVDVRPSSCARIQRTSPFIRFVSMIDVSGGTDACWLWMGSTKPNGYGEFRIDGKTRSAHRVAWELFRFRIPRGVHVLHRCDNRPCVNPSHHFLGSPADNMADKSAKGRAARGGNGRRKLTPELAGEIRQMLDAGFSGASIAKVFGVSQPLVSFIRNGRIWKGAVPA